MLLNSTVFSSFFLPPFSTTDYMKVRMEALKFWDTGDLEAPWLDITADDMVPTFSSNREPAPEGTQKRPNLVKSSTYKADFRGKPASSVAAVAAAVAREAAAEVAPAAEEVVV
jgi:hypothetical protein